MAQGLGIIRTEEGSASIPKILVIVKFLGNAIKFFQKSSPFFFNPNTMAI